MCVFQINDRLQPTSYHKTMTYVSNLLFHANKLFKKKQTVNFSDGTGGSLEDVLICCDDGRSFKYSKILFAFFFESYYGFFNLNILSEDCDVIVVPFHDIGSLLYLINFFYNVYHDESCQLCKQLSYRCKDLSVKNLPSNFERNEEENKSRAELACEDPDGGLGMVALETYNDDDSLVTEGPANLGDHSVFSIEQQASRAISEPSGDGVEVLKDKQFTDIVKQQQFQECQNMKKVCEHCGLTYDTLAQLKNHYYKKHSIKKLNHECEICKKVYMRHCDLKQHLISHSNVKEFKCLECGSEFKRSKDLKKHTIDHGRKFSCEICSAEIKNKRNFERHMSSHNEAKKYACSKCCKYFHRKDKLADHQRTCKSTAEYNRL